MKNLHIKFACLYTFSYLSIGSLLPIIGQYFDSIGFSGWQIGAITSTGTAVAVFASGFWGIRFNRSREKSMVLVMLCIMAAAMCMVVVNLTSFAFVLVAFGAMYFFQAPIMSLTDALILDRNMRFGPLRSFGAAGFAIGAFVSGIISSQLGLISLFYVYAAAFGVSALMAYTTRGNAGRKEKAPKKETGSNSHTCNSGKSKSVERRRVSALEYVDVLRNKKLRSLLLCTFFMGGTNVANNTYFGFLYTEGGGSIAGLGVVMLIMVGSEIPFMAACESLAAKFTSEKMILFAMAVSVVRFTVYGLGLPWWCLLLLSFSQGAVNGIILIEFVRYAARLAPSGKESLAVSAYYILGSSLSTICCQAAGGRILDLFGASQVYSFFGLFNLAGLILYIYFGLYRSENG